jgi:hypothetical protein
MLALTSRTNGCHTVGRVRSRTEATEFSLVWEQSRKYLRKLWKGQSSYESHCQNCLLDQRKVKVSFESFSPASGSFGTRPSFTLLGIPVSLTSKTFCGLLENRHLVTHQEAADTRWFGMSCVVASSQSPSAVSVTGAFLPPPLPLYQVYISTSAYVISVLARDTSTRVLQCVLLSYFWFLVNTLDTIAINAFSVLFLPLLHCTSMSA